MHQATRSLYLISANSIATVPKPKSIVSKTLKADPILIDKPKAEAPDPHRGNPFRRKRANTTSSSAKQKIDISSFTAFILTGEMPQAQNETEDRYLPPPSNNPKKRVTFDTGPPQVAEAAARSMEELLRQRKSMPQLVPSNRSMSSFFPQGNYDVGNVFNTSNPPLQPLVSQDTGVDPVDDADIETDTFKNVNIDSVLHNGVSNLPPPIPRHRASSFASAYNESPSPSPPVMGSNQYSQDVLMFPPSSDSGIPSPRPPPLPPKIRGPEIINASNGSAYGNGSFTSTERQHINPVPSPLPQHNTGPSLTALVPTPTGPVLGKNIAPGAGNNVYGLNNPNQTPLNNSQSGPIFNATPNQVRADMSRNAPFGLNPQLTGPLNGKSFGISPQPTGLQNPPRFGISPQPTGTNPPPVPPLRNTPVIFNQNGIHNAYLHPGNSPSPSLAQFGSIFQAPGVQTHQQNPNPVVPVHGFAQQQQTGSHTFFPSHDSHGYTAPVGHVSTPGNATFLNIPPPPPRRSVSGGATPLNPQNTGHQLFTGNDTSWSSGGGGPIMANGMLAPPPPPSRRRLLSVSAGSPNPVFHSSSASNLPANMGQPGILQNQYTGHQPLYATPSGSNSVPNLLSNGMGNLDMNG